MSGSGEVRSVILTVPNVISALRLVLVPVFGLLIFRSHDIAALAVLAIAGVSDWADGYLARRLNQISRLGQMLDPVADRLFIFVTLVGLVWRGVVPWWLLALIAARDLVLAGVMPVLARHGYGPLEVTMVGKAGTFALLYAFPLLLLAAIEGPAGLVAATIGWAFAWWGVGLYWVAGVLYLTQVRQLLASEHRGQAR